MKQTAFFPIDNSFSYLALENDLLSREIRRNCSIQHVYNIDARFQGSYIYGIACYILNVEGCTECRQV